MDSDKQEQLEKLIRKNSKRITDPADRPVDILQDKQAAKLAAKSNCSLHDVYVAALGQDIWPYRYIRNRDILSREEQLKLANSRVAVVGSGGLGGTVIMLLARIGVGYLTVVDYDVFDETNLNRQAVSIMSNIGELKSEEARKMVEGFNPAVEVRSHPVKIDLSTAPAILSNADVVMDALDNVPDRLALEKVARKLEIPFVHGALAGFDGQVMTVFPEDQGLKLLYGTDIPKSDPQRPEAVLGVPAITPSIVASLQVMEALKILLNRGKILRNRMLYIDLESGRFDVFKF